MKNISRIILGSTAAIVSAAVFAAPAFAGGRHDKCKPYEPRKVTITVQVDKYSTSNKKLKKRAANYDNDGVLKRGEDSKHSKTWEIVTVTGNAKDTWEDWLDKINSATKKTPDLKSSKKITASYVKKRKSVTVAWIISGDGNPVAWAPGNSSKVPQRFLATSRA